MKNSLDVMYKGFLIGSTMLVPGVSGGSMAIILGIYERLLSAISSLTKNIRENLMFLCLFAGGAGVGMLVLAKPILSLLETYPKPMECFFIGAVAGGIPAVWRQAKIERFSWKAGLCFVVGFLVVIGVSLIPTEIFQTSSLAMRAEPGGEGSNLSLYMILFLVGILSSTALVLPGISVSYFLLVLGLYHELMRAISEMDMFFLIPMGSGILIGILLTTKGLEYILKKYPQAAYMVILGFVAGSVLEILPQMPRGGEWLLCIGTGLIGFIAISMLSGQEEV